ncbi:hypothetical protein [Kitasatospora acidiphila]|uniref:hypothetical protein n=1 Tax=Kitasatospora acidiphila TaxID=2567942 RepID=UPI003C76FC14
MNAIKPKVGLLPVLRDPDDHPLRLVQIEPDVWMVAFAPAWATAEQAAHLMRLILGSDIEVLEPDYTKAGDQ